MNRPRRDLTVNNYNITVHTPADHRGFNNWIREEVEGKFTDPFSECLASPKKAEAQRISVRKLADDINRQIDEIEKNYKKKQYLILPLITNRAIEKIKLYYHNIHSFHATSKEIGGRKRENKIQDNYSFTKQILSALHNRTIIPQSIVDYFEQKIKEISTTNDSELYLNLTDTLHKSIANKVIKPDSPMDLLLFSEWNHMSESDRDHFITLAFENSDKKLEFYSKLKNRLILQYEGVSYRHLIQYFPYITDTFCTNDALARITDILSCPDTLIDEKTIISEALFHDILSSCEDGHHAFQFEYLYCFMTQLTATKKIKDIPISLYIRLNQIIEPMDITPSSKSLLKEKLIELRVRTSFNENAKTKHFELFWSTLQPMEKKKLILKTNSALTHSQGYFIVQNPALIYVQDQCINLNSLNEDSMSNNEVSQKEVKQAIKIMIKDLLPYKKRLSAIFIINKQKYLYDILFKRDSKEQRLDVRLLKGNPLGNVEAFGISRLLFVKVMKTMEKLKKTKVLDTDCRHAYYLTLSESLDLCSDGFLNALKSICHALDTLQENNGAEKPTTSNTIKEWLKTYLTEKVEGYAIEYNLKLINNGRDLNNEVHDIHAFRYQLYKAIGMTENLLPDPEKDKYARKVTKEDLMIASSTIQKEIDSLFCTDDCLAYIAKCIQKDEPARDAIIETFKENHEPFIDDGEDILAYVFPHAYTGEKAPWTLNPYAWIFLLNYSDMLTPKP